MRTARTHRCIVLPQGKATVCALVLVLVGCATTPPPVYPDRELRASLDRVAVVGVPTPPAGNFGAFAKSRAGGVGKGSLEGGGAGAAYGFVYGLPAGPFAIVFAVVGGVAGSITGGVQGYKRAVPVATAEQIDAQVDTILATHDFGGELAKGVVQRGQQDPDVSPHLLIQAPYAPAYTALADQGYSAIVEVSVLTIGFTSEGGEQAAFYMTAKARLVDARTGRELFTGDFRYQSPERPVLAWFESGSALWAVEYDRGTQALAEDILDEVFITSAFPFSDPISMGPGLLSTSGCWFRPTNPPFLHELFGQRMSDYAPVDSVQPTLSWEPLPRPQDRTPENVGLIARLEDVRYDLKIWESNNDTPDMLVYERFGLTEPAHRLEYPLKPATRYLWTFRARYRLDGEERATMWATRWVPDKPLFPSASSLCYQNTLSALLYFRLETPPETPRKN